MKFVRSFRTYVDRVAAGNYVRDICLAFQFLAGECGYARVNIIDARKLKRIVGPALLFTTYAKSEVLLGDRHYPLAQHARFVWAQEHDSPVSLDFVAAHLGVDADKWTKSLPPMLRDQHTLLLPVHQDKALSWYVTCTGSHPDSTQWASSVLHAAANVAHDRFRNLDRQAPAAGALSQQERVCLHWISHGKTDREVSVILGIAPRTVRFHLANVKKKLGVHTRHQAVAIAYSSRAAAG